MKIQMFKKSLTPLYVYPKICKYSDIIDDPMAFMEPLKQPQCDDCVRDLLIYIHIPFCKHLCAYCAYYKEPLGLYTKEYIDSVIEMLSAELIQYSQLAFFANHRVKAIQIGGGTPSDIDSRLIAQLISIVKLHFDSSTCELIAMEGNAISLQDEKELYNLKESGVSKLSFGAQTFDEALREKLNIRATVDDLYKAAEKIRVSGIDQLTIDLMYNLPGQDIYVLQRDINACIALNPDYIDIYSLNVFPNTRFKKTIDQKEIFQAIPNDENNLQFYETIRLNLEKNNYMPSMVFTFSKNAIPPSVYEKLYFSADVLGIGPSSRSYLDGMGFRNETNLSLYMDKIANGVFPVSCGNNATLEDKSVRQLVFFPNLLSIPVDAVAEPYQEKFLLLQKEGFVFKDGNDYRLTEKGCLWPGNISRLFFSQEQIEKHNTSFFESVIKKENPYNQDKMGIY